MAAKLNTNVGDLQIKVALNGFVVFTDTSYHASEVRQPAHVFESFENMQEFLRNYYYHESPN
jgi:hypothetical protein